jgi:hypothetical protein
MDTLAQKSALDNTLRNLYCTLRRQGCLLMAIKFEYNGTTYHVDTAAEAATLQRQLKQDEALFGSYRGESSRIWTADLAMDLINGIGELQKKFLAELANYGASVKSSDLVGKMGIDSEVALAGVVSGLSKLLRKMSINPTSLYRVDVTWKGKDKLRYFVLSSDFRDALTELGWPDAWQAGKEKDAASTKKRIIL